MALKLKIVAAGYGFHPADKGKEVEIVDVVSCVSARREDFKILVKAIEGEEYFTLLFDLPFGVDNWVSPRSFGYTTEQIKEMLKKEQEKETPVKEFYKTLKVGDVVKVVEEGTRGLRYNATVKVTSLYDRSEGDYGFDAELLAGFADEQWQTGAEITVGRTALKTGSVVVSPVENKECKGEYSTAHYETYYELTEEDIRAGKIKMDAYFVGKVWKTGSRDDSGALWHTLKTIARFGEKNSVEREIKAIYNQAKALARIYNVEIGDE